MAVPATNDSCINDHRANCTIDPTSGLVTASMIAYLSDGSCNTSLYNTRPTAYYWTSVAQGACVNATVVNGVDAIEPTRIFCNVTGAASNSSAEKGGIWAVSVLALLVVLLLTV